MYGILLLLHLLAATIWTGGHIVLSLVILPKALREQSSQQLLDFESVYEKVGMPALLVQITSGLMLAHTLIPDVNQWFDTNSPLARVIMAKLLLLGITLAFALNARLRVIPNLSTHTLTTLAWHIRAVTIISVVFVVVGVSARTAWL